MMKPRCHRSSGKDSSYGSVVVVHQKPRWISRTASVNGLAMIKWYGQPVPNRSVTIEYGYIIGTVNGSTLMKVCTMRPKSRSSTLKTENIRPSAVPKSSMMAKPSNAAAMPSRSGIQVRGPGRRW